ncbi:MAG: 4-(cytidine 5'-diphospho)-2-C-methyl-D-erythritol kinase [Actinomycetota bacterium]
MKLIAPAKINLYLAVGARRPDGLHEIESVMQSVSVSDELSIEPAEAVTFDVEPTGAAPEDETNLVVRAVRALASAAGASGGASLRLTKSIPTGAGLGGGSSDAAATLVGLNELWRCGISRKALEKIGAGIGADVPFCVRGGTAVARGAGEALAPLVVRSRLSWVIAMPSESLATADVYARFDELGAAPAESDPSGLADALARGDLDRIGSSLRNDLAEPALSLVPSLASVRDALAGAGVIGVVMSGSGSAWCGLARDAAHAEEIAAAVRDRVDRTWAVTSLDRGPRIVER